MSVINCVGCIKGNYNSGKGDVPLLCPRINMPCFAISPVQLDETLKAYGIEFNERDTGARIRIENKSIDKEFIQRMLDTCEKIDIDEYKFKIY